MLRKGQENIDLGFGGGRGRGRAMHYSERRIPKGSSFSGWSRHKRKEISQTESKGLRKLSFIYLFTRATQNISN